MVDNHVITVPDSGLGNSAYLLDLGDGRALAVIKRRHLAERGVRWLEHLR